MKIVAVVPMKLNNQRLPQKNTNSFTNGEPLCTYILETLLNTKGIDEIYVYCSNPEIQNFLPVGVKFLQRSESLDQNTTSMNEVLKAFANDVPADIYILTHATAPFVSSQSIEIGMNMVASGKYDSAFSVNKLQSFLWKDAKPFNYNPSNIPRTQDLPEIYEETCGFYIFEKNVLIKDGRRIGDYPYMVEVNKVESVDIDTKEDFEMADAIFNFRKSMRGGGNP